MKYLVVFGDDYINNKLMANMQSNNDLLCITERHRADLAIKRVLKRKHDSISGKLYKLLFFVYYIIFLKKKIYIRLDEIYEKKIINNMPKVKVDDINSESCIDMIRKMDFDAVLVFGVSILGKEWLDIDKPIINVHLGIAPKYRGRFCWFWPIIYKDYGSIGVTCHFITDKVDEGEIVLQRYLDERVAIGSNFIDIFVNIIELSYGAISELLNLNKPVSTKKQETFELPNKVFYEPGIDDYIRFVKNLDN